MDIYVVIFPNSLAPFIHFFIRINIHWKADEEPTMCQAVSQGKQSGRRNA